MIPKTVAEKVKSGANPVETCQVGAVFEGGGNKDGLFKDLQPIDKDNGKSRRYPKVTGGGGCLKKKNNYTLHSMTCQLRLNQKLRKLLKDFSSFSIHFQLFEQVTIIFTDVPSFLDICAQCDGMKIVETLNSMFGLFDYLSDKHGIYKVETVKDTFVGVSGAPDKVRRGGAIWIDPSRRDNCPFHATTRY